MHLRNLILILFLGGSCPLLGQSASLHALAGDYAGKTIYTTIAWNPFLTIPEYSNYTTCNAYGELKLDIPLRSPRVVQFEAGVYQLYLYMEPGYQYEVALPGYAEKPWHEQISPFYQPIAMPLEVLSRTSLTTGNRVEGALDVNYAITQFDSIFFNANQEVLSHRKAGEPFNTDSIIRQLDAPFAADTSGFFRNYRKFRYGILKLNEGKTNLKRLSVDYLGPTVMAWHPGFVELFRALFKDFIFYTTGSGGAQEFRNLVNRNQELQKAREIVRSHPAVWSDTLADMILLQEFSNLFYRGEYHKEAILIMLDSMTLDPVSEEFGIFAAQLKQKLSSLVTGHTPPELNLQDLEGKTWTLEDFNGKYTYLFFGTTEHYGCMMEYPFLQSYVEKHSEYLNVVTVMVSEDKNKLADFMKRNGYTWLVLPYVGDPEILDDYMVKAYPSAYLIDRDGKLLLSPATLPSEGFEQQLFRIMRSRGEI
jgi:peroxiredoxin